MPRPWDDGAEHRLFKEALEQGMAPIADADIPVIPPLGRNIIETQVPTDGTTTQHVAADIPVPLEDPLAAREAGDD